MADRTSEQDSATGALSQPSLPEDARWNAERRAVGFGSRSAAATLVRVARRVFQRLVPERPTPERRFEAYYLQHTRFESIAQQKMRRQQLTKDGNVGDQRAGFVGREPFGSDRRETVAMMTVARRARARCRCDGPI